MKGLYVLDLGNGDIKGASSLTEGIITYPSIIGHGRCMDASLDVAVKKQPLSNMTVKYEDKEYSIGDMAIRNSTMRTHDLTDDKYTSFESMLLSSTALSLMSNVAFSYGNIVVGLPIHRMAIADQVKSLYEGKQFGVKLGFFGQYEGKKKAVCIEQAKVVAQPHGTLFNIILDDNGQLVRKDLVTTGIAIFDIGYKTNDGIVFDNNLEPIGRLTIHSKNGMHVAFNEIAEQINRSFNGLEIKAYEVPKLIQNPIIRGQDVSDLIDEYIFKLATNIIMEIRSKWDDAWTIGQMVFTGGGSELLSPYLNQIYPNAIYCGQTTNAEGFLKYAKRLWGEVS